MRNFVYIIAEFNPPHNGHAYLVSEARRRFPDAAVVAVMSGHFTQRGTPAVADKFTRARAAISIGVDLVLSLPFPYACSSAEYFARGGVGIVAMFARAFPEDKHMLIFGSETGDADALTIAAERLSDEGFRARLYASPNGGHNARDIAALYKEMHGAASASILDGANDALAIEYLRAASRFDAPITPLAIKRRGVSHDGDETDGDFTSASAIRSMIAAGDVDGALRFVPDGARRAIREAIDSRGLADEKRFGDAVLTLLRMTTSDDADGYFECGGGVGRRLVSAALSASDYDGMLARAATKQYTNARLRRAALFASLGVRGDDIDATPAYTQLLAANARGVAALHDYRGALPILTKPADGDRLPPPAARASSLENGADRLYTLAFSPRLPSDAFIRTSPSIVTEV